MSKLLVRVAENDLSMGSAPGSAATLPPAENLSLPEQSGSGRLIAGLLFALSLAYLLAFRRYTTMEPDEGILLQGVQRILHGQVLYRDFFSFFTPGSYYFLALIFGIFGNSFLVARTVLAVIGAVCSVVSYLLARRVCSQGTALITAALVTLTTLPYRFLVLHNWDSTLWACLAIYCAVRFIERPHWIWAFSLGSFASFTTLFEQSKGAGLCLGLGLGIGILVLAGGRRDLLQRSSVAGILTGLSWPWLITFVYFAAHHSVPVMLADWLWPLQHYSLANRVPYGYQNWSDSTRHLLFGSGSLGMRVLKALIVSPWFFLPVFPIGALGLLAYWTITIRRDARSLRAAYYVMTTAVLSGLLLSIVTVRADIIHFMYLQPLFCLVLAWVIDGRDIPGQWFKRLRPALAVFMVVALLLAVAVPLWLRTASASNRIVTRRGTIYAPARDSALEVTLARVPANESVLVYPYLPLYYYLTDTSNPTRYDYFQPGMNTPAQAQEIISQIQSGKVRVVLFESSFPEKIPNSWPQTPLGAIANDPVADSIVHRYRSCEILNSAEQWKFLFMVLKDLPCPETPLATSPIQ
jgi:4-amino-4-deoxy-L-arabinose transferase-like glycosyltransferase